ncbi:MAG: hypothetical protein HC817_00580 [Saprospiraceae bacterium]|nr:hypothetical protein [Saprospiraceae bacterium]
MKRINENDSESEPSCGICVVVLNYNFRISFLFYLDKCKENIIRQEHPLSILP